MKRTGDRERAGRFKPHALLCATITMADTVACKNDPSWALAFFAPWPGEKIPWSGEKRRTLVYVNAVVISFHLNGSAYCLPI